MKEIKLSKNGWKYRGKYVALVDDADYEWLNEYNWKVMIRKHTNYAYRYENGKFIYIHRVIMTTPDNLEVDHLDCNGLNNQKHNLRNCTRKENHNNPNTLMHHGESRKKHLSEPENLKKHIEERGGISNPIILKQIRVAYEGGKTLKELSKEYDVSHVTIARYIIKTGGKIRSNINETLSPMKE